MGCLTDLACAIAGPGFVSIYEQGEGNTPVLQTYLAHQLSYPGLELTGPSLQADSVTARASHCGSN